MLLAMGSPKEDAAPNEVDTDTTPAPTRRRALELLVAAGSAVYTCSLVVPASQFLTTPEGSAEQPRWLRLAKLDSLSEGVPTRVQVRGAQRDAFTVTPEVTLGSVWLTRKGSELQAFSAECPHLGCAVDLVAAGTSFSCPCHTSRFGLEGHAESGPSPRGMDTLVTRVTDGWIEVEFRRYRQGSVERVEVTT